MDPRLPLRRDGRLQAKGEEEVAALMALTQQGGKSQPGTYRCSSHSTALVTVSDNKMCVECALMLNYCSFLGEDKRHFSCVSY